MNEPDNSGDKDKHDPAQWACGLCSRDAENNVGSEHLEEHDTTLRDDEEL